MTRQIRKKTRGKVKSVKQWKKQFMKKVKRKPYKVVRVVKSQRKLRPHYRAHRVYTNSKGGRTAVLKRVKGQTGRAESAFGRKVDKNVVALPPGKRYSYRTGSAYWETRRNRSDKSRTLKL